MKNAFNRFFGRLRGSLPEFLRPIHLEAAPAPGAPRRLERALAAAIQSMGPAASGRIHVISTQAVVEKLAAQGQKSPDWARQRIETMIRGLVGPSDFLTPFGPDTYVLVLRNLSGEEARTHCGLIVREIAERLFGEVDNPGIRVSAAVVNADGELKYEEVGVSTSLAERIDSAPRYEVPPETESRKAPGEYVWRSHRNAARGRLAMVPGKVPQLTELLKRVEGEYSGLEDELRNAPEPDADAACKLDTKDWLPGDPFADDELEFADAGIEVKIAYRPVWHADKSVIGAYACYARFERGGATVPPDTVSDFEDPEVVATLDRVLLRKSLSDIHVAFESGHQHLAIVPVHCSTMFNSKTRQGYLQLCSIAPEAYRRAIVWEILAPSVGLLDSQLLPAAATLRPLGRSVILCGELPYLHLHEIAAMGVHAVGLDLAQYTKPEKALIEQLDKLGEYASVHRLRTFAHNCSTVSIATSAVCSGVAYLDGDAIADVVEQPQQVTRFGALDVLKPLLYG